MALDTIFSSLCVKLRRRMQVQKLTVARRGAVRSVSQLSDVADVALARVLRRGVPLGRLAERVGHEVAWQLADAHV